MKISIFNSAMMILLAALTLAACKKRPTQKLEEKPQEVPTAQVADSLMTIAYRGTIKVPSSDTLGVATIVLKTTSGANTGTYTFALDFGNTNVNFHEQKVNTGKWSGVYGMETSDKFGDVYVLKTDHTGDGNYVPEFYFQATDNLLKGIDHEKGDFDGVVLTEILPADTLKSRVEVLKAAGK